MIDNLSDITLKTGYSTGYDNLVGDFYAPCLDVTERYDRSVGYFRSTLYVLVGVAFSDFVARGGKARMVCSPKLTDEDISAIARGYEARSVVDERISEEVQLMLSRPEDQPVAELLATMVALRALEIRIAVRLSGRGIHHEKVGIFSDRRGNRVSFVGSINDTFSAWDPESNGESFEVFASWRDTGQEERATRHARLFERLWENKAPGVVTQDFPSAAAESLLRVANPDGIDPAARSIRKLIGDARRRPAVSEPSPHVRIMQPHQDAVLENWRTNGYQGIVDHVTGAGKTVTALKAVDDWLRDRGPVLIVVPSELLLEQWDREIKTQLGARKPVVLMAGGGASKKRWKALLRDFTSKSRGLGPRIVLATFQTASSQDFLSALTQGPHLLVIADEVHRLGASGVTPLLGIEAGGRLGLSATPERFGDPEGTARIVNFFGPRLKPPFGIADAIEAGRLVPYDYFVHPISLSIDEQTEWDRLTVSVKGEFARLPVDRAGNKLHTARFIGLLIRRARILKQAEAKIEVAAGVVADRFRTGMRWLVYCDDRNQVNRVLARLRETGMPADEYHSGMVGSRDDTLSSFLHSGGVLVAIKCLDEGVDIPSVDAAVIIASSRNSREFIQRRGRVLRTSPGKLSAQVHDLIVLPLKSDDDAVDKDRQAIVRGEIRRAREFAGHARNKGVGLELAVLARDERVDEMAQTADDYEDTDDE